MESSGGTIREAKSGRQWDLDASPAMAFPAEVGEGSVRLLGAHSGFLFCSLDGRVNRAARMLLTDPSAPEDRVSLMVMASLEGPLHFQPGGFLRPLELDYGKLVVYHAPEPSLAVELAPRRQRAFDVGLSRRLLQRVGEETPLPQALRRLAEGGAARPFVLPGRIDQRFGRLFDDLLNNPFTHGAARLYQEAKGLEMIAMLTDALEQRKAGGARRWKGRDVERLYEARTRLVASLENPPSLLELAQTLGMSATKLKLGFRQVFGTTVTATLSEARLQRARELVERSELPLKAIAPQCGFCDAASLSHAFVRRFGVTPGRARRS